MTATLPIACLAAAAGWTAARSQTLPGAVGSGATVTIPNGQTWTGTGTVNNQGTIAISGTANPAVLELTGATTLTGGGLVTLASPGFSAIANGSSVLSETLTNQNNTISGSGQIGAASPYFLAGGTANPALILINQAAGVLDAGSGDNLSFYLFGATNSGLATANNGGTLTLGGPGTFNNSGTVAAATGGAVNFGAGNAASNTGLIQSASGGTVALDLLLTNTGGTILAQGAGGSIGVNGGIVIGGTLQAATGGTVALNAGTIQGAALSGPGSFIGTGGTLAAVTIAAGTSFGVQDGATVAISGAVNNSGILAIGGATAATVLDVVAGTTLVGGGTVTLGNGGLSDIANGNAVISNTLTNQNGLIEGSGQIGASLTAYHGGSGGAGLILVNLSGGTIEAAGSSGLSLTTASMTNSGTLQADSGSVLKVSGLLTNWNGNTLNGGVYAALNGTIAFAGANITGNAAAIVLSGANAAIQDLTGNNALRNLAANVPGGSLTLTGGQTLTVSGSFTNGGELEIGPAGTFDVTGGFTQSSSASLDFVLGETSPLLASTLNAGGTVSLGGTLDVSLASGFSLAAGETFALIDFSPGELSGAFSSIVLPAAPGLTVAEVVLPGELELTVRAQAVPEPAPPPVWLSGLAAIWAARRFGKRGRPA